MPLAIGATAAGFRIVRQLEYEEFGELYVAEHPRLPRHHVLHLMPAEVSVDLDYRERFRQESDQAAALWHPNIVGLTDRGEFQNQLWLATEYIDGADAAQLVGDTHPDGMPPRMAIEIVSAIADALDYAHDRGVLHRYVNPGNILVSKSAADGRRIALTGFGVARPEGAHNTLTRAGMFIGTAGYTAPEQLLGDELEDRIDQYALAASAFHLLTGLPPFAHFNPSVVVSKHLNEGPPRPSDVRPDLIEFDAIFARALSQDPVDRYRRGRDFAKALESNGATRSHIRGTSESRARPKFDAAPPTASTARIASAGLARPDDYVEDASAEVRKRRLKYSAVIGGLIVVALLAWFVGVRALRSMSLPDDTPTSVETTSPEPTATIPASATAPTGFIAPPLPQPGPSVTTSTTTRTTVPHSTPSTSTTSPTTPNSLDTRPAIGMPCGPAGSSAVSNSGSPVSCVSTPGGFAWAPSGG